MKNFLGGSIFTHNVVRHDYCIKEALHSLLAVCDEVVVIDAESDDGTIDLLKEIESLNPKLKVHTGFRWECQRAGHPGYDRLAVLANQAKDLLSPECVWHFMLQADEVIHEMSFPAIRAIVEEDPQGKLYAVKRLNLYGDLRHHVKFIGLPEGYEKPCNDMPLRLGSRECIAMGDAESLGNKRLNFSDYIFSHLDRIVIFHYMAVKNPMAMVDKILYMQSWFGCGQDHRVKKMKDDSRPYNSFEIMPRGCFSEIPLPHPVFSRQWVKDREKFFKEVKW